MILYVQNSKLYILLNKVNIYQAFPLHKAQSEEFSSKQGMVPEFKDPAI